MTVETFSVQGMSCQHCVRSVEEEVGAVGGVESVAVDLAEGRVTVSGAFAPEDVRAAIREAGYETP